MVFVSSHAETRLRDLRRMRLFATALLALMTAIFVATYLVPWRWTWLAYLRAFTEAGMIGACADWFAVVALFRHPLGIPIPHTAIVPQNKQRIGGAIGRFISNNFLSPKVLTAKIRELDPVGWAAHWLLDADNARRIAQRAAMSLPQLLRMMPRDDLNAFLARAARSGVEAVPAAPLASKILSVLWAQGETQALVERAIDIGARALTDNRDRIKVTVSQKSSRFIPKWVDAIVADKIVSGLTQLLQEMRDPSHPWRAELGVAVDRLIDDLAIKPDMYTRGEELKAEILNNPVVVRQVNKLWTEIENRLDSNAAVYIDQLTDGLERLLITFGHRIAGDPKIHATVNQWLRIAALRMIAPRRAEIGAFITQVVERWDTQTLVNRIELQVGRDLQYIRINGTLVGGLVGLIIFTITRWV
jgi:uncharacterized membrane-anchored protein YjiN (DUF445 family)